MSRVAGYENDQDEVHRESAVSGLIIYLFGHAQNKQIRQEDFLKFQRDLMNDLLWLEFSSYLHENQSIFGTISEEDFCAHLLSTANLTKKKKAAMVMILTGIILCPIFYFYNTLITYFSYNDT